MKGYKNITIVILNTVTGNGITELHHLERLFVLIHTEGMVQLTYLQLTSTKIVLCTEKIRINIVYICNLLTDVDSYRTLHQSNGMTG
jgi:hypothetical protein